MRDRNSGFVQMLLCVVHQRREEISEPFFSVIQKKGCKNVGSVQQVGNHKFHKIRTTN